MAQKFPRDRFDSIPHGIDRVGAHRAPTRRGAGWIVFGWAALVTVVLVAVGIGAVMIFNDRLNFLAPPAPTASPEPVVTAPPTIAPDIPVLVLNGTTTSGLAAQAGEMLTAGGVPVGSTANARRRTTSPRPSSTTRRPTSREPRAASLSCFPRPTCDSPSSSPKRARRSWS